ncbi:hypothetical protein [Mucilaginibacter sp.]|uniref:hypothetical protein n=1 Tax=Mucilaginibacter sp. TaxID=1882438 RepID=UPI0035BC42A2
MNPQVKRTVIMLLLGVILFAASMAFPVINNSKARDIFQGGGIGLMVAGIISIVMVLINDFKKKKV